MEKKNSLVKQSVFILLISLTSNMVIFDSMAHAQWEFGIDTGITGLNTDEVQGFHSVADSVEFNVELDPDDFENLINTTFVFGGYATDDAFLMQNSGIKRHLFRGYRRHMAFS